MGPGLGKGARGGRVRGHAGAWGSGGERAQDGGIPGLRAGRLLLGAGAASWGRAREHLRAYVGCSPAPGATPPRDGGSQRRPFALLTTSVVKVAGDIQRGSWKNGGQPSGCGHCQPFLGLPSSIKLGPLTMAHTLYVYGTLTPLLLPAESPAHRWRWLLDAPCGTRLRT